MRAAWPGVRVEHVEADDGDLTPGGRLTIRASVALGELSPDDVTVEVVFGRAGDADEIIRPGLPAADPGRARARRRACRRYVGHAELGEPGPFGYTVRVLPSHPLLPQPDRARPGRGARERRREWSTATCASAGHADPERGADTVGMVSAPFCDLQRVGP